MQDFNYSIGSLSKRPEMEKFVEGHDIIGKSINGLVITNITNPSRTFICKYTNYPDKCMKILISDRDMCELIKNPNSIPEFIANKIESQKKMKERQLQIHMPGVKKVIFNNPATIVYWTDGTKTVTKCEAVDTYNEETGFMVCVAKKAMGNKLIPEMKKWLGNE